MAGSQKSHEFCVHFCFVLFLVDSEFFLLLLWIFEIQNSIDHVIFALYTMDSSFIVPSIIICFNSKLSKLSVCFSNCFFFSLFTLSYKFFFLFPFQQQFRLAEIGRIVSPKISNEKYDTGQFFLHRVFGYRGVTLFPWTAKVYDRDHRKKQPSQMYVYGKIFMHFFSYFLFSIIQEPTMNEMNLK